MKKIIAFLLCTILMFMFAACSTSDGNTPASNTPAADTPAAENNTATEYKVGETWTVEGQWELTVTGFTETSDRNEFADKEPAAVYVVDFTWNNIGYVDAAGLMDGLYLVLDDSIIDSAGQMGYSYPGEITDYPQETPVGASCKGQACIGVDNAGLPIKLNVIQYDGNSKKQTATFILE